MHRNHIQISFHKDTHIRTRNLCLCKVDSVKRMSLVIDLRSRRVHVLCDAFVCPQGPASETYDTAAYRMDRKDYPVMKPVHKTSVIIFYGKSCLCQKLLLVTGSASRFREGCASCRSPSETKLLNCFIFKSPAAEILVSDSLTFRGLKTLTEELLGILRNQEKTLIMLFLSQFFSRLLFLNYLNVIFFREIFQSLDICKTFMFHHKAQGSSRLATSETLVYTFCWGDVKRWSLLVMERATCSIVCSSFLQGHKIPYHILNPCGIKYLFYCIVWNHCSSTFS